VAFRSAGGARSPAGRPIVLPRWSRYVVPVLVSVIALIVVITVAAGIWTDFLWFRSVGYTSVFATTYGVKWALFAITAAFMMAVIGVNIMIAYRLRPPSQPVSSPHQQGLEAYRLVIDPHRRLVVWLVLGLIGLISGLAGAGSWRTWLLFANRTSFGVTDQQFHLDISFFVFDYPFIRMVLSFLFAAILLSLLAGALVHYLYGGLRLQRRGERATQAARAHLFILAGIFVLLKAVAYFVDRYGIDFSQRGVVQTGASYTDVNAVLPAKTVLAVIAVICAGLFFAGVLRRNVMLPAVGFGLLVLSAVIIGGIYPLIVQQFVVKPNELAKEEPYLTREISATRAAYGITKVQVTPYSAVSTEPLATLGSQAGALPDVRQLDPGVVSAAFQQLQQVKGYYKFPGVLSVDRYSVPGSSVPQDMIVGVRDMSGPPAGQDNWINSHLVYTHGFGFVAASADAAASGGNPSFTESDIPPSGQLDVRQPRVYFGEQETSYAIVGGHQQELDYPNQSASGQANTTYTGGGGVPVGSLLNRVLYAIKFRELNILLSGAIDGNSKIMYIRDPLSRVAKVAPFLTLDGNAYPVVVGGQILWVVDAYTTTDNYPYSQRISLQQASSDSYNPGGAALGPDQVNYIRNSVKAVVNAYTGAVSLYQWGGNDPVLDAWKKAFPGVIKPESAIPRDLLPHLRYPTVLFEAQRQILAQYHVTQAPEFYGGQNFWAVPSDPSGTAPNQSSQPPYYLTMTMPGQPGPEFSLTTSLTPRGRANMAAFMEVNSNPLSKGYGTIRVLALPQDTTIRGPDQVQNDFESNAVVASALTLLRQGGSKVTEGNLITLPVGGGLVYFEPVYVSQSATGSSGAYPTLQGMLVYYNGQVGYDTTLQGALAKAFGVSPGQSATGSPPSGTSPGAPASATVQNYLQQAQTYYGQAQVALKAGNFAAYGSDLAKMKAALDSAQTAARGSQAPRPAGSPAPSSSPSPSPSASP
jgi:uncharacterized protein